jgi:hypothetical protein
MKTWFTSAPGWFVLFVIALLYATIRLTIRYWDIVGQ